MVPTSLGSFGSAEELDAATGWHNAGHISACLGEKWGYQQGQDITVLPHAPLWFLSLGSTGRLGGRECSEEHQAVLVFSSFFRVWCIQSLANGAAKRNALGHCVCRGNLSIPVERAGCRWGRRAQPLGDSMQLLGAWSGTHPQGTTALKSHWGQVSPPSGNTADLGRRSISGACGLSSGVAGSAEGDKGLAGVGSITADHSLTGHNRRDRWLQGAAPQALCPSPWDTSDFCKQRDTEGDLSSGLTCLLAVVLSCEALLVQR